MFSVHRSFSFAMSFPWSLEISLHFNVLLSPKPIWMQSSIHHLLLFHSITQGLVIIRKGDLVMGNLPLIFTPWPSVSTCIYFKHQNKFVFGEVILHVGYYLSLKLGKSTFVGSKQKKGRRGRRYLIEGSYFPPNFKWFI